MDNKRKLRTEKGKELDLIDSKINFAADLDDLANLDQVLAAEKLELPQKVDWPKADSAVGELVHPELLATAAHDDVVAGPGNEDGGLPLADAAGLRKGVLHLRRRGVQNDLLFELFALDLEGEGDVVVEPEGVEQVAAVFGEEVAGALLVDLPEVAADPDQVVGLAGQVEEGDRQEGHQPDVEFGVPPQVVADEVDAQEHEEGQQGCQVQGLREGHEHAHLESADLLRGQVEVVLQARVEVGQLAEAHGPLEEQEGEVDGQQSEEDVDQDRLRGLLEVEVDEEAQGQRQHGQVGLVHAHTEAVEDEAEREDEGGGDQEGQEVGQVQPPADEQEHRQEVQRVGRVLDDLPHEELPRGHAHSPRPDQVY